MEKLLNDIPNILYDEHIFSHMVDEVLSFDKELKNTYGYPENHPGCLHVLTEENCFEKWLRLEKKCKLNQSLQNTSIAMYYLKFICSSNGGITQKRKWFTYVNYPN